MYTGWQRKKKRNFNANDVIVDMSIKKVFILVKFGFQLTLKSFQMLTILYIQAVYAIRFPMPMHESYECVDMSVFIQCIHVIL